MQDRLVAGDTLDFSTTVADYPADAGWTLVYRLVLRSGPGVIVLTGSPDPDDASRHRVQVAAATTAGWAPGAYSWASWVQQGAERHSLSTGVCTILADPATATGTLDLRSDARRALDDARLAFYTMAANPSVRRYRIAGREMEFRDQADIAKLIDKLEADVAAEERRERAAKGYADKRRYVVRIGAH